MSLVKAALGHKPLDILIRGATLANAVTGEMYPADIGIWGQWIACVERPGAGPAREVATVVDGHGLLAVPGLVDSHMHIESSMVTPARFAEAVLPRGTTTVAEDPHEIANVLGLDGVRLMHRASAGLPLSIFFLVPTCVPAADGLETSGGRMGPDEVREMLRWDRVLGLAEVMDALAVVDESERMTAIVEAGRVSGKVLEGHNPMLRGRQLNAYIAAGVDSDHTLMTPDLMLDKLRLGVAVQLQERYMTPELIAAINDLPQEPDVLLVTDDVAPHYLEKKGHLDQVLRRAIELGMPPMAALRSATVKPARRLRLYDRGVIAPGKRADIVLVRSLEAFDVETVVADGRVVVQRDVSELNSDTSWQSDGCVGVELRHILDSARSSVRLTPLRAADFHLDAPIAEGELSARVIVSHRQGTATAEGHTAVQVRRGRVLLNSTDDLAYIAVFARSGQGEARSVGLVAGLGLRGGALASTVAHDSHNLVVIGREADEMACAANAVIAADGGMAVVSGGMVQALVKLPIAGIMSPQPVPEVARAWRRFEAAATSLGVVHPHLLMRLTTFTLTVATGLRITDRGLVDANRRQLVSIWTE